MSKDTINLKVTTLSNLFIGSTPSTFEIGGVDLFTVTDYQGRPYIPASSIKGSLRNIVRDLVRDQGDGTALEIASAYKEYLSDLLRENMERMEHMQVLGMEAERITRMKERYEKHIEAATAEYLFGMEGFNHTPKLIFNDLTLVVDTIDMKNSTLDHLFSIDTKNNIEYNESGIPNANPRSYKTVRPGVTFTGEIIFHMMDKLSMPTSDIRAFIEHALQQFNTGIYRLGNSGSRGYGRVQVDIV